MSDNDLCWLGRVIELVDDVLDLCRVCSFAFAVGRGECEEAGRDRREAGRGRQR